jgi:S-formylglutathione hydrolase FrmB
MSNNKNKNIMKKLKLISVILFAANMLFGQYKIDTSFYSIALGEEKMVDVYFPPGYDENPSWCYPVIYYLHGYGGDQNTMGTMIAWLTSYINNGIIDPVIMVGADNSPDPLGGSGYVNSILWGNYEDYMVNDLVEWIDNSFRTIPERKGRALLGQSMGGYGAFRYGILHKDKFSVLASHAGVVNLHDAYLREQMQQAVIAESVPGPPYYYNFFGTGINTKLCFLACAMTAPDTNSPQTYINPPIVEFFMDENGDYIDTVLAKQEPYDIIFLINSLSASDSVGIFFGCGENDNFFFYPGHLALKDTMDLLGIPYEFYSHSGDHTMPGGFKDQALTFIDSLLMPPALYTGISSIVKDNHSSLNVFPNPIETSVTIRFNGAGGGETKIGIWNCLGQEVIRLYSGNLAEGFYQSTFDTYKLPEGIYFCRFQIGDETITKKIIKVK